MDIKGQILRRIRPRQAGAFLRSEFNGLGGRSQVTAALSSLVEGRQLERIDRGVYANPVAVARLGRQALLAKVSRPPSNHRGSTNKKKDGTRRVAEFVRRLAQREGVTYTPRFIDTWATSVTSLAGDTVRSDRTDDLLVALNREGKISDREMVKLVMEHHRRLKGV